MKRCLLFLVFVSTWTFSNRHYPKLEKLGKKFEKDTFQLPKEKEREKKKIKESPLDENISFSIRANI